MVHICSYQSSPAKHPIPASKANIVACSVKIKCELSCCPIWGYAVFVYYIYLDIYIYLSIYIYIMYTYIFCKYV